MLKGEIMIQQDDKIFQLLLESIEKKLSSQKMGRMRSKHIQAIKGVVYYLRTGCGFRMIPIYYGAPTTVYYWFKRMADLGCFEEVWQESLVKLNENGKLKMMNQSIDCSIVKAPGGGDKTARNPFDKGKFATKRSIAVDEHGIPISCVLGSARQHDTKLFNKTIESINPSIKFRYAIMHLDKGYDSKYVETALFNHYYLPLIARKKNRKLPSRIKMKKSKNRWVVERTFSWINRFNALFLRWQRKESHYYQLLCCALAIITLRFL